MGHWVLLDYGDIVVHVQHAEDRAFYALDRLWSDSPRLDLPGVEQSTPPAEVVPAAEDGGAVATADAVRARAEEVARFWLSGAYVAYGQAKWLVRSASQNTFAEQLDEEARTIGAIFETDDARARVAAFAQASARRGAEA